MEYKSLFLGVLLAVGVFAMKSGAGGYYYLAKTNGWSKKAKLFIGSGLVYLAVFFIVSLIIQRTSLVSFFGLAQGLIRWAMTIHFIMAAGLVFWGVILVGSKGESNRKSLGWLVLTIPCPVCVMVIFFTLTFLTAFFPDHPFRISLYAYAGFMGVYGITLVSLRAWRSRSGTTPEFTLGAAMLIVAVYFLLAVFIMPHFSELDRIYRLALPPIEDRTAAQSRHIWPAFCLPACFAVGFLWNRKRDRHIRRPFSCR